MLIEKSLLYLSSSLLFNTFCLFLLHALGRKVLHQKHPMWTLSCMDMIWASITSNETFQVLCLLTNIDETCINYFLLFHLFLFVSLFPYFKTKERQWKLLSFRRLLQELNESIGMQCLKSWTVNICLANNMNIYKHINKA